MLLLAENNLPSNQTNREVVAVVAAVAEVVKVVEVIREGTVIKWTWMMQRFGLNMKSGSVTTMVTLLTCTGTKNGMFPMTRKSQPVMQTMLSRQRNVQRAMQQHPRRSSRSRGENQRWSQSTTQSSPRRLPRSRNPKLRARRRRVTAIARPPQE